MGQGQSQSENDQQNELQIQQQREQMVRNQQIYNQIYSQQQVMPTQEFMNQNPDFQYNVPINVSKTLKVQTLFAIQKDSIMLTDHNSYWSLVFEMNVIQDCSLQFFFKGKEVIQNNLTVNIDIDTTQFAQEYKKQYSYFVEKNINFPENTIQLSKSQFNRQNMADGNCNLIIKCQNKYQIQQPECLIQLVYVQFNPHEKGLQGKIQGQKIQTKGQAFYTNEIFGINDSEVNNNDEKVCLICYTEKINTIVIPCKHMCLCMECAELLRNKTRQCPICRGNIESFMKLETLSDVK